MIDICMAMLGPRIIKKVLKDTGIKPYIGFYKECRANGIFLHTRFSFFRGHEL